MMLLPTQPSKVTKSILCPKQGKRDLQGISPPNKPGRCDDEEGSSQIIPCAKSR